MNKKLKEFILDLNKNTEDKKLIWGNSLNEKNFLLEFEGGLISINRIEKLNSMIIEFEVFDSEGKKILNIHKSNDSESSIEGFTLLNKLYDTICISRKEFEEIYKVLTDELKTKESIGSKTISRENLLRKLGF
jgi:hypothetical protein